MLSLRPELLQKKAELQNKPIYDVGFSYGCLVKSASKPELSYSLAGKLYLSKSGWLLLSVPNALIRGVFDAIHEVGAELPVDSENRLTGHISVMSEDEVRKIGANKITELGHAFRYTLGELRTVEPSDKRYGLVWYIKVNSPELQNLRKSYGLTPLPHNNDYDFHITVACRKVNVLRDNIVTKHKAAELLKQAIGPKIIIDRPKGTIKSFMTGAGKVTRTYPTDYGYLENVINPQDKEEADVFVGNSGPLHGRFMKGTDVTGKYQPDEYKWYKSLTPEELASVEDFLGKHIIRNRKRFKTEESLLKDVAHRTKAYDEFPELFNRQKVANLLHMAVPMGAVLAINALRQPPKKEKKPELSQQPGMDNQSQQPQAEIEKQSNLISEQIAKLQAIVDKEPDLEGISIYFDKHANIAIIDTADWGDTDISKRIGSRFAKIIGKDNIIYHNEQGKPKGGSWVQINTKRYKKANSDKETDVRHKPGVLVIRKMQIMIAHNPKDKDHKMPEHIKHLIHSLFNSGTAKHEENE